MGTRVELTRGSRCDECRAALNKEPDLALKARGDGMVLFLNSAHTFHDGALELTFWDRNPESLEPSRFETPRPMGRLDDIGQDFGFKTP